MRKETRFKILIAVIVILWIPRIVNSSMNIIELETSLWFDTFSIRLLVLGIGIFIGGYIMQDNESEVKGK